MYLGIDIGTSGVKAILMDEEGGVVAQAASALTVSRPHPRWSEQDPDAWWRATDEAVQALPAKYLSGVNAIGLAGQMHGATLLGEEDQVLRPAILWNDGRSGKACQILESRVPDLHQLAGNLAMPGFTAPKLVWLKENEPDIFAAVRKVLLPKDYVRLLMTGVFASDMSDSAGTLWLDIERRAWSELLLDACHLSVDHMPELFEGPEVCGTVLPVIAGRWGLPANTPVVGGGGDNAAGAVGVGVVDSGDAFLSLGTSGVLFVADTLYRPNAASAVHTFCHALPDLWHQMSVMLSAASCVDWGAKLVGLSTGSELVAAAEAANRFGSCRTLFLPYLSGERTPHNDPHATGSLFGLTHDSDTAEIGQAILEGVALGFADGLAVLTAGSKISSISVIGGGSRSLYWGRILAAALNRRLVYRRNSDVGPALGAARLAQMGANNSTRSEFSAPEIEAEIEPNPSDVDFMAGQLEHYRALYKSTRDLNQKDDQNV